MISNWPQNSTYLFLPVRLRLVLECLKWEEQQLASLLLVRERRPLIRSGPIRSSYKSHKSSFFHSSFLARTALILLLLLIDSRHSCRQVPFFIFVFPFQGFVWY